MQNKNNNTYPIQLCNFTRQITGNRGMDMEAFQDYVRAVLETVYDSGRMSEAKHNYVLASTTETREQSAINALSALVDGSLSLEELRAEYRNAEKRLGGGDA